MKEIKLEEKILKKLKYNKDKANIEKVITEIKILKDLEHSNIIKYYTSFIEQQNAYIIMELVEGINLYEYINNLKEKNLKIKEKDIIKILTDIISVIKYLHKDKLIIFKDINPHNIMLDSSFNVKLADFGLASYINETSQDIQIDLHASTLSSIIEQNGFIGSILYSSPESVKNQEMTEKSDIWSLGCIIYEMLNSDIPFKGDNPLTVTKNIVELNYKRLNYNDYENKVYI